MLMGHIVGPHGLPNVSILNQCFLLGVIGFTYLTKLWPGMSVLLLGKQ